jgi:hypothetical protein
MTYTELLEHLIKNYERTVRDFIETDEVVGLLVKLKEAYDDTTKRT